MGRGAYAVWQAPRSEITMKLQDRHKGETIIILGGGNSLTIDVCNAIRRSGLITIGMNHSFLMMETNYHVHSDFKRNDKEKQFSAIRKDELKEIYRQGCELFAPLNHQHEPTMTGPPHTPYYNHHKVKFTSRYNDEDLLLLGFSSTSVFQAIQLAVIMGSKKIILVGVDFYVDVDNNGEGKMHTYDYKTKILTRDMQGLEDRRLKLEWSLENKAKPVLDEMGVEVLNASPLSRLQSFPKVELSEVLS